MKQVIYKYPLTQDGEIHCPVDDSEVLHIGNQGGSLFAWVLHNENAEPTGRKFYTIVGTGWVFDATGLEFVTTVTVGPFVWHIFKGQRG